MRIERITVYQVDVPLIEEEKLRLSGGREWTKHDSTIVKVETDEGLVGWGESVPHGSYYLPAYARGVRSGIAELAPALIGKDPLQVGQIYQVMDATLYGHPYVKTAIDMACWDLLGKAANQPLCVLFGGWLTKEPRVHCFIPRTPGAKVLEMMELHRQNGCGHFSTKASGVPEADLEYIHFVAPHLKRGESLWLSVSDLLRAYSLGPFSALNIKIARLGGITKARLIRDMCASLNISMYIHDTGATDFGVAAIAHLAHSTPERVLWWVWVGHDMLGIKTGTGSPIVVDGRVRTSAAAGLGVAPILEAIGKPVAVWD